MKDTCGALIWIVALLKKLEVPFRIEGGLAAQMYGSPRELADIDIGVPAERLDEIARHSQEFIAFGPDRYRDAEWDLRLLTLEYLGQTIDLAGLGDMRYFHKEEGVWKSQEADLSSPEYRECCSLTLPFIAQKDLVNYKEAIGREVDLIDVSFLKYPKI